MDFIPGRVKGFFSDQKSVKISLLLNRRGAGVVDQGRLLSDCTSESWYRGFESRPLRHEY